MSAFVYRASFAALLVSVSLPWLATSVARAGGLELMPGGASAIGRAGAIAARPSNPLTMLHNPAGLSDLADDQVLVGFDMPFHDMCFDPYGYYGWGVYLPDDSAGAQANVDARRSEFGDPGSSAYGERGLDTICNSAPVAPIPQVGFSFKLTDKLSIGFGMVVPVIVTGQQYGGEDGTIQVGDDAARPTPTRYQLVRQEALFALAPMAGLSYAFTPAISVGLALQVTMGGAKNHSVMALNAGTSPAEDMFAVLKAEDYFMPSLTLAVHAKPVERLTVMGSFTWSEGLRGSGDMVFTTNTYHQGATGREFVPYQNDPIALRDVELDFPWLAMIGLRYARPLPGATPDKAGDPMTSEVWDIELDASYTFYPRSGSASRANLGDDFVLEVRRADGSPQEPLEIDAEDAGNLDTETYNLDFFTVRLGGSYQPMPGLLSVSAGGFFETRSSQVEFASIENFGFARVGFGVGVQVRVGSVDLYGAYSHIFQEQVDIAPPPHEPREEADPDDPRSGFDQRINEDAGLSSEPRMDPDAPDAADADEVASWQQPGVFEGPDRRRRVVNAGLFTAGYDVLSLGLAYRF